jgi:hypothetical protein
VSDELPAVRDIMNRHWSDLHKYTRPNPQAYPQRWLWDSCFHSLIWLALGVPDRASAEMETIFRSQEASGFLPHVAYYEPSDEAGALWGRDDASRITHPPMYGHAIRKLHEAGKDVQIIAAAAGRALRWLWTVRRRASAGGLAVIVHPSESGWGSSPQWDSWAPGQVASPSWAKRKAELAHSLVLGEDGAATGSSAFEVASVGFNALIAFNMLELYAVTHECWLKEAAAELCEVIEDLYWHDQTSRYADQIVIGPRPATDVPLTVDSLMTLLVSPRRERAARTVELLTGPGRFQAPYGCPSVELEAPEFDANGYWRGSSWPQMNYLIWLGLCRQDYGRIAAIFRDRCLRGMVRSGFSEYYNPLTGVGLGALPQAWGCLPYCMNHAKPPT